MLGAVESGMFASALGANMPARPMTIDALMDSPEQKPAALSPSLRAPDLEESMFASLALGRCQAPLHQPRQAPAPAGAAAARASASPHTIQAPETAGYFATSNASQRKLSIRNFDGSELPKGLDLFFLLGPHVLARH